MSDQEHDEVMEDAVEGVDAEFQKAAVKVVRAALFINMNSQPIHRDNLRRVAFGDQGPKIKFDSLFARADSILQDTYGYKFMEMPAKKSKGKVIKSGKKMWVLVNTMKDNYLRFQQEVQWLRTSAELFGSELMDEAHDYRNSREAHPHMGTEEELMLRGLALAIVMIIVVSGNHMTEEELLRVLQNSFGMDVTAPIKVLNITPVELLKQLDRQEYVNRTELRSDTEVTTEYNVGRRGISEVDREAFTELTQILYDESEEGPEFTKLVNATIQATYGDPQPPIQHIPTNAQ